MIGFEWVDRVLLNIEEEIEEIDGKRIRSLLSIFARLSPDHFASGARCIHVNEDSDSLFHGAGDELDEILIFGSAETRRKFIKEIAGTSAALATGKRVRDLPITPDKLI